MKTDLFVSYAWTSPEHRAWVRQFASLLHLLGYNIKIDEAVDYGSSLSGFMREVTESDHVLLIVDENYVDRANNKPASGVGIETKWISGVYAEKPATWLSVVFVGNPNHELPAWLVEHKPKGFNFNYSAAEEYFPGSTQIDEVWRWLERLPADKANAVPLAEIRKRAARIERIEGQRDPGNYANPALSGSVTFHHNDHRHFCIGHGEYEFKIAFSERNQNSVYVYTDSGLKAAGLITTPDYDPETVETFLRPGRTAEPVIGQSVVLLNGHGALCVITIDDVQREINAESYIPAHVEFSYKILQAVDQGVGADATEVEPTEGGR